MKSVNNKPKRSVIRQLRARFIALLLVLVSGICILAAWGGREIYLENGKVKSAITINKVRLTLANEAKLSIVTMAAARANLIAADQPREIKLGAVATIGASSKLEEAISKLAKVLDSKEVKQLVTLQAQLRPLSLGVIRAGRKNNDDLAMQEQAKLSPLQKEFEALALKIVDLEQKRLDGVIKSNEEAIVTRLETLGGLMAAIAGVGLLITVLLVWRATSGLAKGLNVAVDVANKVSTGETSEVSETEREDEIGLLMRSLDRMQNELIAKFEKSAKETSSLMSALKVANTSLMLADNEHNIIYMNESVRKIFKTHRSSFESALESFSVDEVESTKIDVLFNDAKGQELLTPTVDQPRKLRTHYGESTFDIVTNVVLGADGERIGVIVEWNDLTEELVRMELEQREAATNLRVKQALDNVSASVIVADENNRIVYTNQSVLETLAKVSEHLGSDTLGQSLTLFDPFVDSSESLLHPSNNQRCNRAHIGERHIDLTLNPVLTDEGQQVGAVVEVVDRTEELAIQSEVDSIVNAARMGDLSKRITRRNEEGFFAQLSTGLNEMFDTTSQFVREMGDVFKAMSRGDLMISVSKDYHGELKLIAEDVNNTLIKLRETLGNISATSMEVSQTSIQISDGNNALSTRTESQASALEKTAANMEQLTSIVSVSEQNAIAACEAASEAKNKAQSGGSVVKQAITAMDDILVASKKINNIIGVINDISFQTNLLALNASVEAARAGEQGRGFAVVAGEVRSLSQRSAEAAKQIKELITNSVQKVDAGSLLVNESGATLDEIVASVETVSRLIEQVNEAASAQSSGINQIDQAIREMDGMTQKNAELVQETSVGSNSLADQAKDMTRLVGFFKAN
ncbi:methyl-accepting chemotaxis protein [Pleionea sp. CnH1-48]|uniref:methyl-accepting chemotaxis protein n=1 Tax=Pleionea sp. CnH1-48 TaxID=2954494 RepID=UPI002096F807|nr:methyl-accepting chemotaxis protein [Pleionea sp. CnH1-48]MCO7223653.1 methyl-accepting chemotaxis protein [Pleionea sp. CnH1-48]